VENKLLVRLEVAIDAALRKIKTLQQSNKMLQQEKDELLTLLANEKNRIEGLQKLLEEQAQRSIAERVERQQKREEKIAKRIKGMLNKFDDLKMLD
jgi:response regulator of citrate/malate metabolism